MVTEAFLRILGILALSLSLLGITDGKSYAQTFDLDALQEAAQTNRDDSDSQARYADALLRAGRFNDAQRAWEVASRLRSGDPAAAFNIARPSFQQDDYRSAQRACRSVERIERNGVWARVCRARAFLVWNRSGRAFGELEAALEASPQHYEALLALGDAHRLLQEREPAIAAYARAERANPGNAETSLALGLLYAGLQEPQQAQAQFQAAVERDADDPRSRLAYANTLTPATALPHLQHAQAIRPRWAPLNLALGAALLSSGDAEGARAQFTVAVEEQDDLPQAHCGLGEALTALEQFTEAEASLNRALELVPNYADAVFALAEMHAAAGSAEQAYAEYRRASGLDPSNPRSLLSAAALALRSNRDVLAAGFLDRLLTRQPQNAHALMLYGDIMVIRREPEEARSYYQRALNGQGPVDRQHIQSALSAL